MTGITLAAVLEDGWSFVNITIAKNTRFLLFRWVFALKIARRWYEFLGRIHIIHLRAVTFCNQLISYSCYNTCRLWMTENIFFVYAFCVYLNLSYKLLSTCTLLKSITIKIYRSLTIFFVRKVMPFDIN